MTSMRPIHAATKTGVLTVTAPSEIALIRAPEIGGLVWRRSPLPSFQTWIEGLPPSRLPRARVILRPAAARSVVTEACNSAATPEGPERERLIDDVAALADIFAGVTNAPWLRLRLDVVTGDACRRFHVDRVTARLVCTYRGTGTQYGVSDADGADPQTIHTVPTGAPFVVRGTLWPAQPDPGLLHRSPPIEGTGETRLMLALDPIDDPEEEA
ncbi:DUF1826 domain-containing protein [Pseudooceanicola batsensis]|nr:DUF1826 domain-containing protein [Pseudooceanicola batsensis]